VFRRPRLRAWPGFPAGDPAGRHAGDIRHDKPAPKPSHGKRYRLALEPELHPPLSYAGKVRYPTVRVASNQDSGIRVPSGLLIFGNARVGMLVLEMTEPLLPGEAA